MPGTVTGTNIILDGYSPYNVNGRDAGDPLKQTIQNVGNFSILYTAAALGSIAGQTINGVPYSGITIVEPFDVGKSAKFGAVFL